MQKQSKANFQYRIGNVGNMRIILIWNKNLGNRTLTNDIENVLADISSYHTIEITKDIIICRDSAGKWDGWDAVKQDFYKIRPDLVEHIAHKINVNIKRI